MAQWSSKHGKREQTFSIHSFHDGLNEDIAPTGLPLSALTSCRNMKYAMSKFGGGNEESQNTVIMKLRQGTTKISHNALPSGADVLACTYYVKGAQYILATASKVYYLNGSLDPVEIGSISGIPTFTEFHGKLIIHDSGSTKAWDGTTFETLSVLYMDEIIETGDGATVAFSGVLAHPAVEVSSLLITYTSGGAIKTIHSNTSGELSGDTSVSELMPNQADRDLSAASAWTNVDFAHYAETDYIHIWGYTTGQYCTLPVASAPTTIGHTYTLSFDCDIESHTFDFVIKSYDGTQTIATMATGSGNTVGNRIYYSFEFTASTTGGLRIVAIGTAPSYGVAFLKIDNFSLKETGGVNTVTYATGAYSFTASAAPDNTTPVYAQYRQTSGVPPSKAGFVRGSRLYTWGDAANPSRLSYTGVNDEYAWDSSSDGGYLDCDPLDGYSLISCVNYFDSVILIKSNSIHRLDDFPGDNTFEVVPVVKEMGGMAYRTCLNDGGTVSFLSKKGWLGLTSLMGGYEDINLKMVNLSEKFQDNVFLYGNQYAYAEYNQLDKQLWLTLFNSTTQFPYLYVVNLATGGQISIYEFAFDHTSYKFINDEMLIGGADGNLYKLLSTDSACLDNAVSYATDTKIKGVMTDWGISEHRKHNKYINVHLYGSSTVTATLNIYTNRNYSTAKYTASLSTANTSTKISKKLNYQEIQFELTSIYGATGVEVLGIDFTGAIIGR